MTAEPHPARSPIPARTPAEIRAALDGADRAEFERAYQTALSQAATDYDLTPVQDVVDRWWPIAVLAADPAANRRMLDTAAALRAGDSLRSTSWETVRRDLGV
jgi:Family of unknown function (DUF6247)